MEPSMAQQQQQQQQQQSCLDSRTRERRSWNDLSCDEQSEYVNAVQQLKSNGIYDHFVQTHIDWQEQSHGVPEFLPWHRYFIYQFESALRTVSPCITLPYWDWERDAGRERLSDVLQDFRIFEGTTTNGQCNWPTTVSGGGCLQRDYDPSIRFWSERRIVALVLQFTQYADDFPNDPNRNNGFRAEFEGGARTL
jgi:tyrosinase